MKTVKVVAAVIKAINEHGEPIIFATQRGYGDFKGGWEFPGGKIEAGESLEAALKREISEELDTEISVGRLIDTVEYDYPNFHLSMDCFWCEIVRGDLTLKEHEAAKWLDKDSLYSVEWLPADISLIEKISQSMQDGAQTEGFKPGCYRHYKGNEYRVLYIAKHSETLEPMVVYQALYGAGEIWVRPASMWNEMVEKNGEKVRRFEYVGE